jgi:hypothetical protein
MRLYAGPSKSFVKEASRDVIATRLKGAFFEHYRYHPPPSEVEAWRNSLRAMSQVIEEDELDDHAVVLEYQLPLTSRRLDCMVLGCDGKGNDGAVIVELKQWSGCDQLDGDLLVRTILGGAECDVLHPSAQVGQYQQYLEDLHTAFHEGDRPVQLASCSYLHNYHFGKPEPLLADKFADLVRSYPIFGADDPEILSEFLRALLGAGDGLRVLRRFDDGRYRPSKKLLDHVGKVIKGLPEYVLLDEQLVVFDKVRAIARNAVGKTVILVRGGPGTGKSVIAMNLLAELCREGRNAHYVTGSRAFTQTLRKVVGSRAGVQFKYFNSYTDAQPNSIDVAICDEAHRIRETSNNRFTPVRTRSRKPQIQELIDVSRVSVFFIDDRQVVRPDEVGSSDLIRECAAKNGCSLAEFHLEAQFRCAGSDGFVNWVNNTLGLERTANVLWNAAEEEFEFRIFDSPWALEAAIREKAALPKTLARLAAGFCWPWSHPNRDGTLANDVVIGDYARPWNAKPEARKHPRGIPRAVLWAHDPNGINQIGCVYTAQGFEFDYIGVIWGPDLVFDPDRSAWRGDPSKSHDRPVKRGGAAFIDLVKNTYRVLLSRGLKGCYVYFMDKSTERFIRSRLEGELRERAPLAAPDATAAAVGSEPFRRLRPDEVRPFENSVPLYDLQIAAGRFGDETLVDEMAQEDEVQRPEDFTWVELPREFRPGRGLFVARVVGESMNRRIPNGAWCLFRLTSKPTSRVRPIVARLEGQTDPETGRYTIKLCDSEKDFRDDESFETRKIILRPQSSDPAFQPIVLSPEGGKIIVVAELLAVLA